MAKKNLIFFMTDQQRVDTFGMEVNGVPVTPNLTRLTAQGTRFDTAYDTCPLCVPARTALATGKNPLKNGMQLNDLPGKYAQDHETLHTILYQAGYEVAHIGVNHISIKPPLKDRIPYAAWQDDDTYAAFAKENGLDIKRSPENSDVVKELCDGEYLDRRYSNAHVTEWKYDLSQFKDVWYTQHAVDFLKQPHEKPFALFVYLWAPHPPLIVPKQYLDMFPMDAFTLPENTDLPAEGEPSIRRKGAAAQLGNYPPEKGWKQAWSAHCALSRLCDDQLGRLLDTLDEQGLADDTLVVCTTDHGEQLGQHRMYQKMEMYEPAVRVMASFKMPGAPANRFTIPVSHLDFVPTVLDLLDVPAPEKFEGDDLADCIRTGSQPPKKDVFGVYCGNHAFGDMRRMIVRDRVKYVWDGTEAELYDLEADPLEMNNLANDPAHAELRRELHETLKNWAQASGDTLAY